jgi:hypothetical protein
LEDMTTIFQKNKTDDDIVQLSERMLSEFKELKSTQGKSELQKLYSEIMAKQGKGVINLNKLYDFESLLINLYPDARLRTEYWSLLSRYKDLAGDEKYNEFLKVRPIHIAREKAGALREEAKALLNEVFRLYVWRREIEIKRRQISKDNMSFVVGLILVDAFVLGLYTFVKNSTFSDIPVSEPLAFLFLICSFGVIGSCMSVEQRLQSAKANEPSLSNVLNLRYGQKINFSRYSGAVFAVFITLVFCSNAFQCTLFPSYPDMNISILKELSVSADYIGPFFLKIRPSTFLDLAKLLVWCFIAGFAERFVPDVIDRLIGRTDVKQTKNPQNNL